MFFSTQFYYNIRSLFDFLTPTLTVQNNSFSKFLLKHTNVYTVPIYSGITSMIHMKLGDIRFEKTVPKWTEFKLVFFSEGSLSLNLEEWFYRKELHLAKKQPE